ncbi:MAG: 30S ribosomal protein S20 [Candidatus Dependentiae bacterium]|nr:30S ribosomal protein S20 [Candidatus Dependentiae bacterium]
MANIKSAKKRVLQDEKRRLVNAARRTALKTAIKKVDNALESGATQQEAEGLLRQVASQLGRARGKGVVHANAAARRLSRVAKRVAKKYRAA